MTPMEEDQQRVKAGSGGTLTASLAALGSVIVASSCCIPLLPFLFAAGAAGASGFFVQLRPYLLGASVLFIAFGFRSDLAAIIGPWDRLQSDQHLRP